MHKPLSEQQKAALIQESTPAFDEWLGLHKLMINPADRNDFSTGFRNAYRVTLDPTEETPGIIEETKARLEMAAAESGYHRRTAAAVLGALAATQALREEKAPTARSTLN